MTLLLSKVAWDHLPTVTGYKRLSVRRGVCLCSFSALFLLTLMCVIFGNRSLAMAAFFMIVFIFPVCLPWVAIAFIRRLRVKAILRSYPWREWPCQHPRYVSGSPATIAIPFREEFTALFRIIPFPIDLTAQANDHPDRIWFAGDPRFGGVVSPVGGHYPVRVVAHVPRREECGGEGFELALRVGLVRRSGKGTRT
ncbi:hypothetical protein OG625_06605 [Streptomyces sp. NBC_01351]|uniref:hypothetical protein n=1 Tax=Streptomyces sp. NBC_01351 TaxID=2903833 RepID=UPI002E318C3A|nr:hypothetical protein [Streptomyces sp. NBC_01351]